MALILFLQGALGAMISDRVSGLRPVVYTYAQSAIRGKADKNWLRDGYPIRYIKEHTYDPALIEIKPEDTVICSGWTKDFFHNTSHPFSVWYTHPSLLPSYRGYGAVSTQFLRGVAVGGVTLYMDNGRTDAGPVAWQQEIIIGMEDTPMTYMERCADTVLPWIKLLADGDKPELTPQDERLATHTSRLRRKEALLDFSATALYVFNSVRAFSHPYPGAYFLHGDNEITVWKCSVEKWAGRHGAPGEIVGRGAYGVEMACGEGSITLSEIDCGGRVYTFDEIDNIL